MSDDLQNQSNHSQWVLRDHLGEEKGPYSTQKIIELIREGAIKGTERIKKHPYGKWILISKRTEFYDTLLEALEDAVRGRKQTSKSENLQGDSEAVQAPPKNIQSEPTQILPRITDDQISQDTVPAQREGFKNEMQVQIRIVSNKKQNADLKPLKTKKTKRSKGSLIGLTLALFAGAIVFLALNLELDSGGGIDEQNHLIPAKTNTSDKIKQADAQKLLKEALSGFIQDTFEGYLLAEKKLVRLIENAPKLSEANEARGLLCLTYKELWPYMKQDSTDLDALLRVSKLTRQKDPFGINSVYCEVSRIIINGKNKDAKGLLDYSLGQEQFANSPILFNLKAEMFSSERDHQTAALYAAKAIELWPEWAKPRFDYAEYSRQAGNGSNALDGFQQTLKLSPKHKAAAIKMGIQFYSEFKQYDSAMAQLKKALETSGRMKSALAAEAHFTMSKIFYEKKELSRSLASAQKAFSLNPSNGPIRDLLVSLGGDPRADLPEAQARELIFIGDQYARTGDCLAAQAEYKTAYDLDSKSATAALKAAKCLWDLNQRKEAIDWLNKAIAADKKFLSAYTLKAEYLSAIYNYGDAIKALNDGTRLFPNNSEILRAYGLVSFRRQNYKEALSFLIRSYKVYDSDVETLILLSRANGAVREYKESLSYALRATELDYANKDAQIAFAQANAQMDGPDAGIKYIKSMIAKFSYTIEFRMALADIYRSAERFKLAQDVYEQITLADSKNKEAFLGLGDSQLAQGLFEAALKSYLSGAILDPSDPDCVFRIGKLYFEKEKYKDAVQQFRRAANINPYYPRLNYFIARSLFKNGQYEDALKATMEERKANPSIIDTYVLAGDIHAAAKQFALCAEEYQGAIKINSRSPEIYLKLARCQRQSGSIDIAESMLNIAVNQNPNLADVYKEQGAIYQARGDRALAKQAYEKYLEIAPGAADRSEIENIISNLQAGK